MLCKIPTKNTTNNAKYTTSLGLNSNLVFKEVDTPPIKPPCPDGRETFGFFAIVKGNDC